MGEAKIIQDFLSSFSSKQTKYHYGKALKDYFKINGVTDPNTYFEQNRDYKQDTLNYCKFLKGMAPKTFIGYTTAIKSFFDDHEQSFPKKTLKKYQKRNIGKGIAITRDQVFTKQQLKQILAAGDIRARALFLVMASSGIRPGEALNIKLSDLDYESFKGNPVVINIRKEIAKNKMPRITFISNEAKEYLEQWLKIRKKHLETYQHTQKNLKKKELKKKSVEQEERVFPFTHPNAWKLFHRLLRDTDNIKTVAHTQDGKKKNVYHLHTFRKFARTYLPQGMPLDQVEQILGHEGYLSEYRQYPDHILAESYRNAMHTVEIFESGDIAEVNEEMNAMKKRVEKMENLLAQKEQMVELIKNRYDNLENKLEIEKLKNGKNTKGK